MPYSKDIRTYPAEYWDVAKAVLHSEDKRLEIPFETLSAAIAYRGKFNFWKTLVKEDLDGITSLEEVNCARALIVRLEPSLSAKEMRERRDQPAKLIFQHADYTESAKAIRSALAALKLEPTMGLPASSGPGHTGVSVDNFMVQAGNAQGSGDEGKIVESGNAADRIAEAYFKGGARPQTEIPTIPCKSCSDPADCMLNDCVLLRTSK